MSTLALYLGIFVVALAVIELIPGARHFIPHVVRVLADALRVVFGSGVAWIAWLIRTLWQDHWVVARHLVSSRSQIDPTDAHRHR
jgi:hypothetical protein